MGGPSNAIYALHARSCPLHAPCNAHVTPRKHYMTVTCPLHEKLAAITWPELAQNLPNAITAVAS